MVLLSHSTFSPRFPFTSGHFQTLYPTLFRKTPATDPVRKRLELKDGDFLDIDLHESTFPDKSKNVAIISHGLEGNSRKKYVVGMARALTTAGWDAICLNFRGCSGEINRLPRMYHSGVTDDLHSVLTYALQLGQYSNAALIGFSMGGNQTLKYVGEGEKNIPHEVKAAVVFSVPCNLADSGKVMNSLTNRLYMEYFMKGLHQKIRIKAELFPDIYDTRDLSSMKTFYPFDDKYTAPVHGFSSADDYYRKCSSHQFLDAISIPTLLVQAQDDPFLPKTCYPLDIARNNKYLHLEMPLHGGHVGFSHGFFQSSNWMEDRAVLFLKEVVQK